jgi:hypothetical protein
MARWDLRKQGSSSVGYLGTPLPPSSVIPELYPEKTQGPKAVCRLFWSMLYSVWNNDVCEESLLTSHVGGIFRGSAPNQKWKQGNAERPCALQPFLEPLHPAPFC